MRQYKFLLLFVLSLMLSVIPVDAISELEMPVDEDVVSLSFSYSKPIPFRIYIPTAYREHNLPVLYLLHGQGQSEKLWEDLGTYEIMDKMLAEGTIKPMIIVAAREAYYYQDMDESEFPSTLISEVIPSIDNSFPTIKDRRARAIGGISRGALWAQMLFIDHYDQFSILGQHSLPNPFYSDYIVMKRVAEHTEYPDPAIYIDTGNHDPYYDGALDFSEQLGRLGLAHELHLGIGDHDEEYWKAHVKEYLIWYSNALWANINTDGLKL